MYFHGIGKVRFSIGKMRGGYGSVDWRGPINSQVVNPTLISVFNDPAPFRQPRVEVSNLAEKHGGFGAPSKSIVCFLWVFVMFSNK